jgi:tripartite-type tricarboxylate transporter receptor subunit TctC
VLRALANMLSKIWGQPVVVNNRPGAGGFVAIEQVKSLPADGYHLLQLDSEQLAALPLLYKSRNFDTFKTFDAIAGLYVAPFMVTVPASSKWNTMADLIAEAKANPGKLTYGSWGVGSPSHLGAEQIDLLMGTEMRHIPFRDMGQLFTSVGSNDLSWSFGSIPSSRGPYQAGKIRYLAAGTKKRLPQLPDVPTISELGGPLAGFESNSFVVLVASKGMPTALRDKLNQDIIRANNDPELKARYDAFAFGILNWSPEEVVRQAEAKGKIYSRLIERKNISLD